MAVHHTLVTSKYNSYLKEMFSFVNAQLGDYFWIIFFKSEDLEHMVPEAQDVRGKKGLFGGILISNGLNSKVRLEELLLLDLVLAVAGLDAVPAVFNPTR